MIRKILMKHEYLQKVCSNLNIEDVTVKYYEHAKRVSKKTEIKNLVQYHDLRV